MQFDNTRAPLYGATGGYGAVILAHLAVACVIIVAMLVNGTSAVTGIVVGALYYAAVTLPSLAILSGTVTTMWVCRQEQITAREMHRLQYAVDAPRFRRVDVDPVQTPHSLPAASLPERNFVPALTPQDEGVRKQAVLFAMQLYGADGLPDPSRVILSSDKEPPGRLKVAAPKGDARKWLEERRFLYPVERGIALNLSEYPTAADFGTLL